MTERSDLLHRISEVLADLYDDQANARRVARGAGLSVVHLSLAGAPVVFWSEIVHQAEKQGVVEALLALALREYPGHTELPGLRARYRQLRTTKRPPAPPVSPGPSGPPSEPPPDPLPVRDPRQSLAAPPAIPDRLVIESPIHLVMIRIPAGEFTMGSDPAADPYARANEQPRHRVYLPDYYISKYCVTGEQYGVFLSATRLLIRVRPGTLLPKASVEWQEAVSFCLWLSRACGRILRLPSEAEWEKAARGTDGRIYPWGNEAYRSFEARPRAKASPYGVMEMAGDEEWTASLDEPYPYRDDEGRNDPQASGPRVARSEYTSSIFGGGRCASRRAVAPESGATCHFRVALSLPAAGIHG